MSLERGSEYPLANGFRFLNRLIGEAVTLPRGAVALDEECTHVRRVSIMMRIERAEFGFHKSLRQCLEPFCGAVPGKFIGLIGYRGAEIALESTAYQRVQAIGRENQVFAGQLPHGLDQRVISRGHADSAHALLQDREQIKPADRGKTDAVDIDAYAARTEGNVLPAFHPWCAGIARVGVGGAQKFKRLLGEHDAETPSGAGGILLKQIDVGIRVTSFPKIGEIETSGASADHGDTQDFPPPMAQHVRRICKSRPSFWGVYPQNSMSNAWPLSALERITDSSQTSRQVRKVRHN